MPAANDFPWPQFSDADLDRVENDLALVLEDIDWSSEEQPFPPSYFRIKLRNRGHTLARIEAMLDRLVQRQALDFRDYPMPGMIEIEVKKYVTTRDRWFKYVADRRNRAAASTQTGAAVIISANAVETRHSPPSVADEFVTEDQERNDISDSPSSQPRWKNWAIGLETGNEWQLFRRLQGKLRQQTLIENISSGRQHNLLKAFAEHGGFLPKGEAIKMERPVYSAGDVNEIMDLIKPELTNLRDKIRAAIGQADSKADPLLYDHKQKGWRAEIAIGYAVQEDSEHIGGERRLRFKTRAELTKDEAAER